MNNVIACVPTKKLIVVYSSITFSFTILVFLLLIWLDYIYQIGKHNMYMLPLGLIISEVFKYNVIKALNQNEIKMTKSRKIFKKLKFKEIYTTCGIICCMIGVYYFICIIFGAPLLTDKEETLMFSILLTTLTVIPPCLHLGPETAIEVLGNLTTFKGDAFCKMFLHNIQFTLVGAWLGAVVIPLDWDRPWQVWPIPCCSGALMGHIAANVANVIFHIK